MRTSQITSSISSLNALAAAIDENHRLAQQHAVKAVAHARACGEQLIEAKAALPHGEFGAWLRANFQFSERTAQGYMRLAGLPEAKAQRVADLSLREALRAIAEPKRAKQPEVDTAQVDRIVAEYQALLVMANELRADTDRVLARSPDCTLGELESIIQAGLDIEDRATKNLAAAKRILADAAGATDEPKT